MITDLNQLDLTKRYTYADYLTWQFQERVELLHGWIAKMSPAPSRRHQVYSWRISAQMAAYFEEHICDVYTAPFDVRLPDSRKSTADKTIYTVVQPDLCVVCDKEKLDDRGCIGAPDWIIEILSPGNSKKEVDTKFRLYEEAGVREYWMLSMDAQNVIVCDLKPEGYHIRRIYPDDAVVPVGVFPGLEIDLKAVFRED